MSAMAVLFVWDRGTMLFFNWYSGFDPPLTTTTIWVAVIQILITVTAAIIALLTM